MAFFNENAKESSAWQKELLDSFTSLEDLVNAGFLSLTDGVHLKSVASDYRIRVSRYYASLFNKDSQTCPIKLQALPHLNEDDRRIVFPSWALDWCEKAFGKNTPWHDDAIGDFKKLTAPRLTHRYGNRALLHLSSLCSVYCRFCFRKTHLNDDERLLYSGALTPALSYLKEHTEINELILTGGDPLSISDHGLEQLFSKLSEISHLKIVRIHTRMPVTLPSRLTATLAKTCLHHPFKVFFVSHFNHPKELTAVALSAIEHFQREGVLFFNQSVLLRGVNDRSETLENLFNTLYENGIRPVYLHYPDWTPGTFHFRPGIPRALELFRSLSGKVSGPALPQLVLDIPGGAGKIPLTDPHFLKLLNENEHDGLSGGLYEIQASKTRLEQSDSVLYYVDLWKKPL